MINFEKQIADQIAVANGVSVTKLGLRFDKVAVRLLNNLRSFIEQSKLKKEVVLITITAPVRLAAKTETELKKLIKTSLDSGVYNQEKKITVFQNEIQLKVVEMSSEPTIRLVGMIHNPGTDSKLLLALMIQWLTNG